MVRRWIGVVASVLVLLFVGFGLDREFSSRVRSDRPAGPGVSTSGSGPSPSPSAGPSASPAVALRASPLPSPSASPVRGFVANARWQVRVYNIDDVGTAYVNNREVFGIALRGDSGLVNINSFMTDGDNYVRFTLYNGPLGYGWGFQILKDGNIVWRDEAGVITLTGAIGANNDDHTRINQIVYDKTLVLRSDGTVLPE